MARFTSPDGTGAPGPVGPAGQDANTADFTFVESTMNTGGNMTIGVTGVPGDITLTAYSGVNIQYSEPNGGAYLNGVAPENQIATIGDLAATHGIPAGGNAGDILAKINGTDYNTEWIENYTSTVKHIVKNGNGSTISIGTPVYTKIINNSSTNIMVGVASNAAEATSSKTMGIMAETIAANATGFVITEGLLTGINTSTANQGDPVWLGANGALIFGLANKPIAPAHLVFLGVVTRGQTNNGEIFVKIQNGFELNELHDVDLDYTTPPADNDLLAYDTASSMWKNQTAAEAGLAKSGAFNYTQTLGTAVSNVSTATTLVSGSITTNGYPVHIIVTGDGEPSAAGTWARLQLYRGTTAIGHAIQIESNAAGENTNYALQFIDTPAAGTYTYSLKTNQVAGGSITFGEVNGPVLCIMELGK